MTIIADGGRGTGVNPYGTDYPLVEPSDDISRLLADAYLMHNVQNVVLPLRLSHVKGLCVGQDACESSSSSAGPHEADIEIKDANDVVVFDSTTAAFFRSVAFGRFHIFEWRSDEATCRMVVHAGQSFPEDEKTFAYEFDPVSAVLDERVSEIIPLRASRIVVGIDEATNRVELVGGYNVELANEPAFAGRRSIERITINATPGSGLGKAPVEAISEPPLKTINGVSPNKYGDFCVQARSCLQATIPSLLTFSTLQLWDVCTPCCKCADFVKVYKALVNLTGRYRWLGKRAEFVRLMYEYNRSRWISFKTCVEDQPARLSLTPTFQGLLDVNVGFCSPFDCCLTDVSVTLTITSLTTGEIVSNTTFITSAGNLVPYVLGGSWPVYNATWTSVAPHSFQTLQTRFSFPEACMCSDAGVDIVSVTAAITWNDVTYPLLHKTAVLLT